MGKTNTQIGSVGSVENASDFHSDKSNSSDSDIIALKCYKNLKHTIISMHPSDN